MEIKDEKTVKRELRELITAITDAERRHLKVCPIKAGKKKSAIKERAGIIGVRDTLRVMSGWGFFRKLMGKELEDWLIYGKRINRTDESVAESPQGSSDTVDEAGETHKVDTGTTTTETVQSVDSKSTPLQESTDTK